MREFRVLICGEDCLMPLLESESDDPPATRFGFYATLFILADSAQQAGEEAVALVRAELEESLQNKPEEPPRIVVEEASEGSSAPASGDEQSFVVAAREDARELVRQYDGSVSGFVFFAM
jgi:hypothetical protein